MDIKSVCVFQSLEGWPHPSSYDTYQISGANPEDSQGSNVLGELVTVKNAK